MSRSSPAYLKLVHSSDGRFSHGVRQIHCANGFDPLRLRSDMPDLWRCFIRATQRDANNAALAYGVTLQTGLNWLDPEKPLVPMGDKVVIAARFWPEQFGRIVLEGAAPLRAVA